MPGITANEFLRYPLLGETVDATSWQNLANDIETALTSLALVVTDAKKPPACMVTRVSAPTAITVATDTPVLFPTNTFADPSSMHSTSSNTDQILPPSPGIYWVRGSVNITSNTTLTAVKAGITLNGTQVLAKQERPATTGWITEVNGIVLSMAAGDIIRLIGRWSGTGTGTLQDCQLHVIRISKW